MLLSSVIASVISWLTTGLFYTSFLMANGIDIVKTGGRNCGYYIANRTFELPELKLLVDAVQSSKFITVKKSNELIKKVESLASKHEASLLPVSYTHLDVYKRQVQKQIITSIIFLY